MNSPDLQSLSKKELIDLANAAIPFKEQQKKGKRPEAFRRYIESLVKKMDRPTFLGLIFELELAALRRAENGENCEPIESVNRIWETVIFHDKKKGRIQKPFGTVKNCLTRIKKNLSQHPLKCD